MGTIELVNGYDRAKKALLRFRNPENIAEMVSHCNANSHIWFRSNDGTARRAKVNGIVRIWKRDANRIEVPIKYGMYEYGIFTASDIGRVLIPV
jgi:hypothetical protein